MPRPRTGHAHWSETQSTWIALITLDSGKREPVLMRHIAREDEAGAKAFCALLSKRAKERGAVSADTGETCAEYFDRWAKEREARGLHSVADDHGRWKKWIAPTIGTTPIAEVTTRELEQLVSALDKSVRAKALAWKTALHVWGLVTKLFDDAHRSKDLALRVRKDNPAKSVRGPDRGHEKARAFLFPSELLTLLACGRIPLRRRRLYAFAVYTGLRAGEIRALDWSDVHEDEGYIHVHQATDYRTDEVKPTKTGLTRKVAIEPALRPLLEAMRGEQTRGQVVPDLPHKSEWPWLVREDLKAAGVMRVELHTDTDTKCKLDFHDLRHTYGTWRAIRGDDIIKIRFALGHTDMTTTQRYINEAHAFDPELFGIPFGPLPSGVLANSLGNVSASRKGAKLLRPQRDSKAPSESASEPHDPLEITADRELPPRAKPSDLAERTAAKPSVETLRRALDAAILAEQWDAVKIVGERLREAEREAAGNVIPMRGRK